MKRIREGNAKYLGRIKCYLVAKHAAILLTVYVEVCLSG